MTAVGLRDRARAEAALLEQAEDVLAQIQKANIELRLLVREQRNITNELREVANERAREEGGNEV